MKDKQKLCDVDFEIPKLTVTEHLFKCCDFRLLFHILLINSVMEMNSSDSELARQSTSTVWLKKIWSKPLTLSSQILPMPTS